MKQMQSLLLVLILTTAAVTASAQHIFTDAASRNKKPAAAQPATVDSNTYIEEKLVRLALQSPAFQITDNDNRIADLNLKKAKNSWMDLLSVSTNYNDQSFNSKNQQIVAYPKYFFGLTIPIGVIFNKGSDIKIARETAAISRKRQEDAARSVRAEVLSRYAQYKRTEEMILVQSQVIDDEQAVFMQVQQKFRDGTASLTEFNAASKALNVEMTKRLSLKMQQDLYKIELEKYIGMPLEEALKN